ncbi:MAG: YdcF family protein [SAR324 cluster bacterium]|nr:YdcF family protein [SAR324 cluster bacterium]
MSALPWCEGPKTLDAAAWVWPRRKENRVFVLSKLLTAFALPPGLFVTGLFVALILVLRRRRRAALLTLGGLMVLIYFLSLRPVADSLLGPLETGYQWRDPTSLSCDVIVVLGGGVVQATGEAGSRPELSSASLKRGFAAFALWRKAPAPIVLSGGSVFGEEEIVSESMARFLKSLGVPQDYLHLEVQSRNTLENARQTTRLLDAKGWRSPCVVSSAYHLPRAMRSFAHFGVQGIPVPAGHAAMGSAYTWRDYFPSMGGLTDSSAALHEYLGLLYYRLLLGI